MQDPLDPADDRTAARTDGGQATLDIDGIRKEYGEVTALDGVDITIEPGTFHCIVGPNGSGKTTLFRIMLGLTRPSGGAIRLPDAVTGVSFQEPNFYDDLSVAENIDVFGSLTGVDDEAWVEEVVAGLRLERARHRRAGDLSGGFAKKLDLALGLIKEPAFLLLDEPLSDLDDISKEHLLAFLDDYCTGDRTVVVSTHQLAAFEDVVDRLTVMNDGEVVFDERDAALRAAPAERGYDSLHRMYVELVRGLETGKSASSDEGDAGDDEGDPGVDEPPDAPEATDD